jgi:hypothetical protein
MRNLAYPKLRKIYIRRRKIDISPYVVNLSSEIAKWDKLTKILKRRVK